MPRQMSSVVSEPRMESRSASRFSGRRVHFIGIGGSGMSGLARMLLDNGAIVRRMEGYTVHNAALHLVGGAITRKE